MIAVDWRIVGLKRDPETNRAYLQIDRHHADGIHPFDSIEVTEDQILALVADGASMLQILRMDPAPPPPVITAED